MTPGEQALQRVRDKRRATIQRKLDRIADLIGEAAFILRIDYPAGKLFVEGDGSISALSQNDNEATRQGCVIASARFDKADCDCGAW